MHRRMAWAALAGVWWLAAAPAQAHMRNFLLNQDYYTAGQGEFEVELYNDYNLADSSDADSFNSKHQIELEYGITDHVQAALYDVVTWDRADHWEQNEWKAELKARLAEAGQWPVDVALYTEYANPDGHENAHSDAWENKLILAKDLGPVHVAANVIAERLISTRADWEWAYTLGASYALSPRVRPMLEYKESLGSGDNLEWFAHDHAAYLLPGVAVNVTPHLNVLAGAAFGLTRASDDVQLRSIVEFEF